MACLLRASSLPLRCRGWHAIERLEALHRLWKLAGGYERCLDSKRSVKRLCGRNREMLESGRSASVFQLQKSPERRQSSHDAMSRLGEAIRIKNLQQHSRGLKIIRLAVSFRFRTYAKRSSHHKHEIGITTRPIRPRNDQSLSSSPTVSFELFLIFPLAL
jgi:hypothetical protein